MNLFQVIGQKAILGAAGWCRASGRSFLDCFAPLRGARNDGIVLEMRSNKAENAPPFCFARELSFSGFVGIIAESLIPSFNQNYLTKLF